MRLMAGRAIETCVKGTDPAGGVTTRYIHRTLDWLTAPYTDFPSSLDIRRSSISTELHENKTTLCTRRRCKADTDIHLTAASTTFITAWVYADLDPATDYEPGANSEKIGEEILEALDLASLDQHQGSALRRKLEARYDYISQAVARQDQFMVDIGWPAWWSNVGPDSPPLSNQKPSSLGAQDVANNESSNAASRVEIAGGDCGVNSNGLRLVKCNTSISRKSVKRLRRMTKA